MSGWTTLVAICAAVGSVRRSRFLARLTAEEPIVDIRAFTNRKFRHRPACCSSAYGIGLYGLTYLYPRYLAEVRGYSG